MTPSSTVAIPFLASVLPLAAATADLTDTRMYRQSPPGRTFGISSDTEFVDDLGIQTGAITADNFSVAQPSPLCRVKWWGFYGSSLSQQPGSPPPIETMRIQVFGEASGLPGALLHETTVLNPSRVATGFFIVTGAGPLEYVYEAPLSSCMALQAGVTYWLAIAQIGDVQSRFRWENYNVAGGFAQRYPVDAEWRQSAPEQAQMAYELWTPEPHTSALLALALAFRFDRIPHRGQPA